MNAHKNLGQWCAALPVISFQINSFEFDSLRILGAVQRDRDVFLAFSAKVDSEELAEFATKHSARLLASPASTFAILPSFPSRMAVKPAIAPLANRNVLCAFRHGEQPSAVADWLRYHRASHQVGGALILDRSAPGTDDFANQLAALKPDLPIIVVSFASPLGPPDGPDMRDPSTAPAAPKRTKPCLSPWQAPLHEMGVLELLRWAFLAKARAVACLGISDLLLPVLGEDTVFDRAAANRGRFVPLRGTETYPWRLRKAQPARHFDHIARRMTEPRRLASWCLSPGPPEDKQIWQVGAPFGLPPVKPEAFFMRAMGVVYPGVPVGKLVRKADLAEDPELLALSQTNLGAKPIRLPKAALIAPRPKTARVTVVSAMKNEGPFLLDWIAHNRAIGIDRHLVYTNDCEDGTDALLDALKEAGVERRDNPYRSTGQVPQHAAFRDADKNPLVTGADWLLTLDVDEYINIHVGDGAISDLLDAVPKAHAVSMPWRLFGNSHCHRFRDSPVVEQFTQCAPAFAPRPLQAWAFKTLFRNADLFRRLGVHRPKGLLAEFKGSLIWVDGCGKPLSPLKNPRAWRMSQGQWGYDLVSLNHYAVRSAESFLVKRERGKVNRTKREQGLEYWFRMNHNAHEDRSILRLSTRVAKEKSGLMALPEVKALHDRSVGWHQDRIKSLLAKPDYASLFADITSARMEHLSKMATFFGTNVHMLGPKVIPDDVAYRPADKPFYWSVKLRRKGKPKV